MPIRPIEVTTFANIPSFVPFGVYYFTQDTADLYVGTGASTGPAVVAVNGGGGGTGTVTSVTYTGDGTIFSSTPTAAVTTAGTLTPVLNSQPRNQVLIGPSSGANAAPTFRVLSTVDIPSSLPYVTSVAMTGDGTIFNTTVAGSAITTSGTLVPALLTQAKNTFLAGPVSGSNAAPTFRAIGSGDVPSGTVTWDQIGNAANSLTLSNGTNNTEFDQTTNATWLWKNTTTATSGTTNASPLIEVAANYWTGAASAADVWSIGSSLASGTNGQSTLAIAHAGSANASPTVTVPNLTATLGGINLQSAGAASSSFSTSSSTNSNNWMSTIQGQPTMVLQSFGNSGNTGYAQIVLSHVNPSLNTSGTIRAVDIGNAIRAFSGAGTITYAPTSGNANFITLAVSPVINQTSGANGTITDIMVNSKETAVIGTHNLMDLQAGSAGTTSKFLIDNSGNAMAVGGYGLAMVATTTISSVAPVKMDTSNANQVVITSTTDTGPGLVVGVCINSPNAGATGKVITTGIAPMVLGTGTVSIGNFIIVDTTTNGRVKATTSYPAPGALIGIAMAALSTVGNSFNVAVGLR